MADFSVGIVGHVDRIGMVNELADDTNATFVSVDDGTRGCAGNHAFVLSRLMWVNPRRWAVILEDDAEPQDEFMDTVEGVLDLAPSRLVSFYLGTGYPQNWQRRITEAIAEGTCWIGAHRMLHAVAYAAHPSILPSLNQYLGVKRGVGLKQGAGMAPDDAISVWAAANNEPVSYTNPSLVEHRDGPTVLTVRRFGGSIVAGRKRKRVAHNLTPRDVWDRSIVTMPR